ncbi:MAG: metallophosphoesterase [Planctomycetes bacterium]|nr:metallophosphoesterase [Planctomycetota bacterium]
MLTGRRSRVRRWLSWSLSMFNRAFDRVPPSRWLHRWAQRGLGFPEIEIPLRRGAPGLDGLRIAFVSDIHAGSYMDERDLCRIFAKIAARKPDVVCLGGDLINTREREILLFRRALAEVAPPLGVFAVPGNHDHFWGKDLGLWSPFLREQGVEVLTNRGVRIERDGGALWLAGVDDLTEGEPDLDQALRGARHDEPVILLSHHPDFFFEAAAVGIDLTLSGHTHGGQICVLGKAAILHSAFGYQGGHYREADSTLFVSRGVGATVLPLRIGAPAEVPIFTVRIANR